MSNDSTINHINSINPAIIQGVGCKPERHTGINPNWDCILVVMIPFGLIDLIAKLDWVKSLKRSNEGLYDVGGWVVCIILFFCGLALTCPYMKFRDKIFPPREFVVYVGINDEKRVITRNVSKKRAIYLCNYMAAKWGFDHYQTEAMN